MFIYRRNVSVSIVVAIIRKRNNDALTNNTYSFFLKYIQTNNQTDRQTHTHTHTHTHTLSLLFIRKMCHIRFHGNSVKEMWAL
jgi:hypothetical protein